MPSCTRTRWPVGWLLGALVCTLAFAGCIADTSPSGDLTIELELSNGTPIDEVSWAISGNGMPPMAGTINTSAPGSTASVEVYGIPAGEDYTIMMTATSTDGETSCSGSADFDIAVGELTQVMVMLNCKPNEQYGGVRVNGKFNFCADLIKVVVSPLQTSIGNQIDVEAKAIDLEGDPIEYVWTGTGGSFADPSALETTYTCEQVGDQTITITVSDDGFEFCDCNWTVDITCVEDGGTGGTGGTGGMGATGGQGGMGGMAGSGGMAGTGGMAGSGGMGGMAGTGGMAGMGGIGGSGGIGGIGGMGGMAGTGGMAGMGGIGGSGGIGGIGGTGGMGGEGGMGGQGGTGGGVCIPDGGAPWAGSAMNRPCGEVSCGERQVCVDQVCVASSLVFVSTTQSDAALGGPRGADQTCADLAEAAGLGGYWFSWTSDRCTSPFKRFEKSTVPYRMIDGSEISSSWLRMTMNPPPPGMGYLETGIDIDEFGDLIDPADLCRGPGVDPAPGCFVWTNTTVEGHVHINNGCLGLTTNNSIFADSTLGKITSVSGGWTNGKFFTCAIDTPRIYCFEQSTAEPIP